MYLLRISEIKFQNRKYCYISNILQKKPPRLSAERKVKSIRKVLFIYNEAGKEKFHVYWIQLPNEMIYKTHEATYIKSIRQRKKTTKNHKTRNPVGELAGHVLFIAA